MSTASDDEPLEVEAAMEVIETAMEPVIELRNVIEDVEEADVVDLVDAVVAKDWTKLSKDKCSKCMSLMKENRKLKNKIIDWRTNATKRRAEIRKLRKKGTSKT